jgi:DNA-binding PadR family transcriptional regulator
MWVEVLLLSKLARGSLHGYELRKEVEAETGHKLSNNSLYPTLRRFVESGAVLRSSETHEAKPPRHVYTITDIGRELLHDLIADLPGDLARNDSEFLTRVANFSWLHPEERVRVLDVRYRMTARSRERLGEIAKTQSDPWQRRVMEHICRGLDDDLAWVAGLRSETEAETIGGG